MLLVAQCSTVYFGIDLALICILPIWCLHQDSIQIPKLLLMNHL
jgi:hypothetical protein